MWDGISSDAHNSCNNQREKNPPARWVAFDEVCGKFVPFVARNCLERKDIKNRREQNG